MQKANKWGKLAALFAAGEFPIFVNSAGALCWNNGGHGPQLPADMAALVPADVVSQARSAAAERMRAHQQQEADRAAAHAANLQRAHELLARHRARRAWRLTGLFVGDQSSDLYTLDEIEQWADFAAGYLGCDGAPTLYARIDWPDGPEGQSDFNWQLWRFQVGYGPRDVDYERCVRDLRDYHQRRRRDAAPRN